MITIRGTVSLLCEGQLTDGRYCLREALVEIIEPTASDSLQDAADELAREIGWGDHRTCPACHAAAERDFAECEKADAERLERSMV